MRLANKTIYDDITKNISRVSDAMIRASMVVSSGKKINNLSDDPVGLINVLDLRSSISDLEQMGRNITMGKSWLNIGESALNQAEGILSAVKVICVEMSSANKTATARANAAIVVDGYMRQILSLANTQAGGRYIFSGNNTDTQPFAFDDDTTPTQVTYSGNDTAFSIKIARSINVAIGRDGEDIFGDDAGTDNMFQTLIDLKTYLESDNVTGIQGTMDKLDAHMVTVRNMITDNGAKMIRMNVKEEIIAEMDLIYTDRMSELEDADIAEAIMDLQTKELAYQAALRSAAKVMSLSLVDLL